MRVGSDDLMQIENQPRMPIRLPKLTTNFVALVSQEAANAVAEAMAGVLATIRANTQENS